MRVGWNAACSAAVLPMCTRFERRSTLTAVLVAAALVSSCDTSSTVSTGPNPVKCLVSLTPPPTIDSGGGTGSVSIATQPECAWDASTNVAWISGLSPAAGQGTAALSFRVAANSGSSSREGMIAVNGEQARVSQRAPCRYDLAPSSQSISSGGGTASVTIATSTDCAWTATAEVNWIRLTSSVTGSGNGTVAFTVTPHDGPERTGAITAGGQRSLVTQADGSPPPPPPSPSPPSPPPPPVCTYSISPTSDDVSPNEGAGTVNVFTSPTCTWTATSHVGWLTIESGTKTGSGAISYRMSINFGPPRTGTLTIAGHTFTVSQAAIGGNLD
jgi:hypothetical protein